MPTIRTKMEPWRELEVTDQEYTDLERQGLLHEQESEHEETGTGDPEQADKPAMRRTSMREKN